MAHIERPQSLQDMFRLWDANRPYRPENDPHVVWANSIREKCVESIRASQQIEPSKRVNYLMDPYYFTLIFSTSSKFDRLHLGEDRKDSAWDVELALPQEPTKDFVSIHLQRLSDNQQRIFEFRTNQINVVLPNFKLNRTLTALGTSEYRELNRLMSSVTSHISALKSASA